MKIAVQILISFILVPVIDYVWLGYVMKNFYLTELGSLARLQDGQFNPMILPAVIVYILLAVGIVTFVIPKAEGQWLFNFVYGALLGLVVYGVYDMTNLSTLQNWSMKLSLVDMMWGGFLCGTVALITDFMTQKFGIS